MQEAAPSLECHLPSPTLWVIAFCSVTLSAPTCSPQQFPDGPETSDQGPHCRSPAVTPSPTSPCPLFPPYSVRTPSSNTVIAPLQNTSTFAFPVLQPTCLARPLCAPCLVLVCTGTDGWPWRKRELTQPHSLGQLHMCDHQPQTGSRHQAMIPLPFPKKLTSPFSK